MNPDSNDYLTADKIRAALATPYAQRARQLTQQAQLPTHLNSQDVQSLTDRLLEDITQRLDLPPVIGTSTRTHVSTVLARIICEAQAAELETIAAHLENAATRPWFVTSDELRTRAHKLRTNP